MSPFLARAQPIIPEAMVSADTITAERHDTVAPSADTMTPWLTRSEGHSVTVFEDTAPQTLKSHSRWHGRAREKVLGGVLHSGTVCQSV